MPRREAGTSKGRRLQGFVLSYFGLGCLHHLLGGGHNFQLDASAASATLADNSTWPQALLKCFVVAAAMTAPFSGAVYNDGSVALACRCMPRIDCSLLTDCAE